jgi:hypothetical protein
MFIFYFVGFKWIIILDVFGWLCFEIGSKISNNVFLKLVLHMSWIVIFHRILNSSMDHEYDKVMYMLCMFRHMLLGGCWRSIIKLSNVCPCALKLVKQKAGAKKINIYWLWMFVLVLWNLWNKKQGKKQLISIDYECFGSVWFR